MKLLLLKILLQRRNQDEGFTLPMVIALGLVMLLLGTVNIVKSNEENITAINTNSSSDALAIAEVGITKYRELLDRNRILTVYNDTGWTTVNDIANQTCDIITTTPNGWEDNGTAAAPNNRNKWWRIEENIDGNPGDEFIGEYQLVSYIYDLDDKPATANNNQFAQNDDSINTTDRFNYNDAVYNPRGILTVKGRSPDGSEAQIEVDIPLRINQQDMNNLAPALWMNNRSSSYISNLSTKLGGTSGTRLDVSAGNNVVLSTAASSSGCTDPSDVATNNVIGDPRTVPSIDYVKDTLVANAVSAGQIQTDLDGSSGENIVGQTSEDPYRELTSAESSGGATFDKNIHCKNISDCRYYYRLSGTPYTIDKKTYTDGVAKATLFVESDLLIDKVDVGSNISSSYFEIYVDGNREIEVKTTSTDPVVIDAFIHAPGSVLKITGNGEAIFNGSVWVNRLINETTGAGKVTINPDNTSSSSTSSDKSYEYYTTTVNRTPRPLTGTPTKWVREVE